jgi:hypothetical protein
MILKLVLGLGVWLSGRMLALSSNLQPHKRKKTLAISSPTSTEELLLNLRMKAMTRRLSILKIFYR